MPYGYGQPQQQQQQQQQYGQQQAQQYPPQQVSYFVLLSSSPPRLCTTISHRPYSHRLLSCRPFHSSLLTSNSLFLCVLQQAYSGYPAQAQQAPIAKPAAASVWSEHKTDDGNTYWYNASTGVSQVCDKASCRAFMKC